MIARILLPNRNEFSVPNFVQQLRGLVAQGTVVEAKKVDGKILVSIGNSAIQLGISSKPVNWDFQQVMRFSAHWAPDAGQAQAHGAQLMLGISGSDDRLQQAKWLTTAVSAAMQQCPAAIGVHWNAASQFIPATGFRAAASDPNDWTSIWISMACQANAQGSAGCTRGMAAFGQRELETQNATESVEELYGRLMGLADYLLQNGPIVKDGETFGQTSAEKITVVYANQSSFGNAGPVMNLDYSANQAIPQLQAQPQPIVAERVSESAPLQSPINPSIDSRFSSPIRDAEPSPFGAPKKSAMADFGMASKQTGNKKWPLIVAASLIGLLVLGGLAWAVSGLMGGGEVNGEQLVATLQGTGAANERLKAAEKLVGAGEQLFFGNTNRSMGIAGTFSREYNSQQLTLVDADKIDDSIGIERTEAYCEEQGKKVAIICSVPGYSEIDATQQQELSTLAWQVAYLEAMAWGYTELAVGIRDGGEYGSVQHGDVMQLKQRNDALTVGEFEPADYKGTDGAPLAEYFKRAGQSGEIATAMRYKDRRKKILEGFGATGDSAIAARPNNPPMLRDRIREERDDNRIGRPNQGGRARSQARSDGPYKFRRGEKIVYRGEIKSETARGKLDCDFDIFVRPGDFDTLETNGSYSALLMDRQGMPGPPDVQTFQSAQTVSSKGKVEEYQAQVHLPLISLPVNLLPFIEFPEGDEKEWTIENPVEIRTVVQGDIVGMGPRVRTEIRYPTHTSPRRAGRAGGFGGPPPGFGGRGFGDPGFGAPPPEVIGGAGIGGPVQLLHSSDGVESRRFTILRERGDEVVLQYNYDLTNEDGEASKHEIKFEGQVVFDRGVGMVVSMELDGDVKHQNDDLVLEAPFKLTLRQSTEADEQRRKDERQTRIKQREQDEEAAELEDAEKWKPENVVARLKSKDKAVVEATIRDLRRGDELEPPNTDIGRALIALLVDKTMDVRVSSTVYKKWITKELGSELLTALPEIHDTSEFMACFRLLNEFETEGLPETLITCLEVEEIRTWAFHNLMSHFDEEIELLFHDLLDNSEDEEALAKAVSWLMGNGTSKSIGKLRKLAKRVEDSSLQGQAEGAIRLIDVRNNSSRRRRNRR